MQYMLNKTELMLSSSKWWTKLSFDKLGIIFYAFKADLSNDDSWWDIFGWVENI